MFQKWKHGDFPGSLVVKTPHFHCRGTGVIAIWGTGIQHTAWYNQEILKKGGEGCMKMNKTWVASVGKTGSVFVKVYRNQKYNTHCMINDCFHKALCPTAVWTMTENPVHQDPVPFVTGHLIIAVSQESLFRKSCHPLEFQYTLLSASLTCVLGSP